MSRKATRRKTSSVFFKRRFLISQQVVIFHRKCRPYKPEIRCGGCAPRDSNLTESPVTSWPQSPEFERILPLKCLQVTCFRGEKILAGEDPENKNSQDYA